MPNIIPCPSFEDERGALTVLERCLPFDVRRVYWMTNLSGQERGGHRHLETTQALICLSGECEVEIRLKGECTTYRMERANQCLILHPEDWHLLKPSKGAVILVLASKEYDANDYADTPL